MKRVHTLRLSLNLRIIALNVLSTICTQQSDATNRHCGERKQYREVIGALEDVDEMEVHRLRVVHRQRALKHCNHNVRTENEKHVSKTRIHITPL